jgi:hypothetical protein
LAQRCPLRIMKPSSTQRGHIARRTNATKVMIKFLGHLRLRLNEPSQRAEPAYTNRGSRSYLTNQVRWSGASVSRCHLLHAFPHDWRHTIWKGNRRRCCNTRWAISVVAVIVGTECTRRLLGKVRVRFQLVQVFSASQEPTIADARSVHQAGLCAGIRCRGHSLVATYRVARG